MTSKSGYFIAGKILARIERGTAKPPASAGDFLDLGTRAAVDQALSRLVRRGKLQRVGRGLYAIPRVSRFTGTVIPSSPDDVARAYARKLGLRILPLPAHAANLLGLSTQVPAKIVYLTDGRARTINEDSIPIVFRHGSPKTMAVTGRIAPMVFQALRYLGKKGIAPSHISRLCRLLKKRDKRELLKNLNQAPGWMKSVLIQIAGTSPEVKHGPDRNRAGS